MKFGVIGGAGRLGSTTAFTVGLKNIVDEIKLMDVKDNFAATTAMDMNQALMPVSKTRVTHAKSYEDFADCDIILSAAAAPFTLVKARSEELGRNMEVVAPICEQLKKYCRDTTVVLVSANPVDVFVYAYQKLLGWNEGQILGLAVNDTIRLKWATELATGKEYDKLDGLCVGEHGHTIQLLDEMTYEGKPLTLSEEERARIDSECRNWFSNWQAQKTGTTTGWTSGVSMAAMIEAIVTDSNKVIPCTTTLADTIGYDHCAMGLPCVLGRGGAKKVADFKVTDEQKAALAESAEKISEMITSINL